VLRQLHCLSPACATLELTTTQSAACSGSML
jgi:hypothetical protein